MAKYILFLIFYLFSNISLRPALAVDDCGQAHKLAKKAYEQFNYDNKEGIRLFGQAQQLCTKDAAYSYNLGLAYFRFGRPDLAIPHLDYATKVHPDRMVWLNNLAEAQLINGTPNQAIATAIQAVNRQKTEHSMDVYARALLASGDSKLAWSTIKDAKKRYPRSQVIRQSENKILDGHITIQRNIINSGSVKQGLDGLKAISSTLEGAKAYINALYDTNQYDESLRVAEQAVINFRNNPEIITIRDAIYQKQIQQFYNTFARGDKASAVANAQRFSEIHPNNKAAKQAFDDLLTIFLTDTSQQPSHNPTRYTSTKTASTGNTATDLLNEFSNKLHKPIAPPTLTIDVEENIPSGAKINKHGVGIIIGNQHYNRENSNISDVKFAERDAITMKKYLTKVLGYDDNNIIIKIDATIGDLNNIIGTLQGDGRMRDYIRDGRSDLFFYYVGHGAPGQDGKSSYLVPVDANIDRIANTGYDLKQLYKIIERLPAKKATVILDSCFSGDSANGSLFKNISPAMLKSSSPIAKIGNFTFFAGADKGQVSTWYPKKQHSMFSYFFFKGLQGHADANKDFKITAGEMKKYLNEEVPYMARRHSSRKQNPIMRGEEDTIIAELKR
ncbi:MAG: caspase family protein [Desulfobulbaceae bacterium]|nr:caspase family protein [Desulfobulbaceae bacterium]